MSKIDMSENSKTQIQMKVLYVKFLCMVDSQKHKDNPLFFTTQDNPKTEDPVYDVAFFYAFTHFGYNENQEKLWIKTEKELTSKNKKEVKSHYTGVDSRSLGTLIQSIPFFGKPPRNSLWRLTPHYNGFQKKDGKEWAAVGADHNTKELRLLVDFSSLIQKNQLEDLFTKPPHGWWEHKIQDESEESKIEPRDLEFQKNYLFSLKKENVSEEDILRLRWSMNWDYLDQMTKCE